MSILFLIFSRFILVVYCICIQTNKKSKTEFFVNSQSRFLK